MNGISERDREGDHNVQTVNKDDSFQDKHFTFLPSVSYCPAFLTTEVSKPPNH